MKKTSIAVWIASFLVLSLFTSGCDLIRKRFEEKVAGKFKKTEEGPPSEVSPSPAPVPSVPTPPVTPPQDPKMAALPPVSPPAQDTSDQALISELNSYVDCMNRSGRANDSYRRYLMWVNETSGPTCKEMNIYGLYSLYEDATVKCTNAAQKGKETGPSLPALEQAAGELAAAYSELSPLVKKAVDYYDQQDYKDDNCAKAKEMHPPLIAAFKRYQKAVIALESGVDTIKKDLDVRELARLEKERGRTLAWYSKNYSLSAKKLMETLPKENMLQMSPQNYLNAYAQLDKDYQAYADYAAAHPDEGKNIFWYSSFESSAKGFFTKAKFLKRDLAEGKKPDANSLNGLIGEYNRFVSDSNNVKF